MNKKYLLYLDILGFSELASEIAAKKGLDQRLVRQRFIGVIEERVSSIEKEGKIIGKKHGESDDWLLVTDSLGKTFNCILELHRHNTLFENYENIPLEIAIGTAEFDIWSK